MTARETRKALRNICRLLQFSHRYMRPVQGYERSEDAVDHALEIARAALAMPPSLDPETVRRCAEVARRKREAAMRRPDCAEEAWVAGEILASILDLIGENP